MDAKKINQFRTFLLFWFSQVVSQIGSQLTSFGLGVWVYQKTGSVTDFALISMFGTLPGVLLAPFLGTLVDKWDRKKAILLSDSASALVTLSVAILLFMNRLELWEIYVAAAMGSTLSVIQSPAVYASIPLLVPQEQLGRVNGLMQLGQAVSLLLGPALAGVLVVTIKIQGVIFIDFATFLFAAVTLLFFIRIPKPRASEDARDEGSFLKRTAYSLTYLKERPGLLGLLFLFMTTNFVAGIAIILVNPLVLSFTNAAVLGAVVAAGGAGMIAGSLTMSTWGGPKKKIYGVFIFVILEGLFFMVAGLRAHVLILGIGIFGYNCALMLDDGCYVTIFQKKVAQNVQGRIFALNHMVTKGSLPVAYLVAGFLADRVFEPLFHPAGALAGTVGKVIGTGTGRGMGFMFILCGLITIVAVIAAMLNPRIRHIEKELPDSAGGNDTDNNTPQEAAAENTAGA